MAGLQGTYSVSLDSNGRLAIPAKIRNAFPDGQQDKVIITRGLDSCVTGYYQEKWDAFIDSIGQLDISFKKKTATKRRFIAQSFEAYFDKQGRITIPTRLLDYAGLEKSSEVYVMGCDGYLEIWNPERFDAEDMENEDLVQDVMSQINL